MCKPLRRNLWCSGNPDGLVRLMYRAGREAEVQGMVVWPNYSGIVLLLDITTILTHQEKEVNTV